MQSQFIAAINQLCDEKNLPREVVIDTVKAALRAAYRKDYGSREQNIDVDLDDKSGNVTIYLVKEVVKNRGSEEVPGFLLNPFLDRQSSLLLLPSYCSSILYR